MPTLAERILERMGTIEGDLRSAEGVSITQVVREVLQQHCGEGWSVSLPDKPFPHAGAPKEEWAKVEGATKKWILPDGSIIITNWIDIPEKVFADLGFAECWCRSKRIDPECTKSHVVPGMGAKAASAST